MIQIIAGTFGYFDGVRVVPITSASGSQCFDPELEERLVRKGIAKYVKARVQEGDSSELPEYHANMKLEELKKIAAVYGVDASECKSKKEVVELIDAHCASAKSSNDLNDGNDLNGGGENQETPPNLLPADPV